MQEVGCLPPAVSWYLYTEQSLTPKIRQKVHQGGDAPTVDGTELLHLMLLHHLAFQLILLCEEMELGVAQERGHRGEAAVAPS